MRVALGMEAAFIGGIKRVRMNRLGLLLVDVEKLGLKTELVLEFF